MDKKANPEDVERNIWATPLFHLGLVAGKIGVQAMRLNSYQWGFWKGWANEFDLFRVALEWRCYNAACFRVAILGFQFGVTFPALSYYDLKRKFKAWWYPCDECGGRFGNHDESKEHFPF